MDRTDGYQIGDVTIQGVRAYDPTTAQWTSPDAYAGTTTDPGSQKPFMWNGNNPVAYGDPSGYDKFPTSPKGLSKQWVRESPERGVVRGQKGEWFRNSENGDWIRFDPPSPGEPEHWHGFLPDERNPKKTPGGFDPPGPKFRNNQGKRTHKFLPGENSPDFHNSRIMQNDCACYGLPWMLLAPRSTDVPDLPPLLEPSLVPVGR